MTQHTKKEIEVFLTSLFPELSSRKLKIDVGILKKGVEIEVTAMYSFDPPTFDFKRVKAISDFFDTTNIDTIDTISQEGCETCDWGSRYGSRIRVSP